MPAQGLTVVLVRGSDGTDLSQTQTLPGVTTPAQLLAALGLAQTGTSTFDFLRTPTIFKQNTATASGSTALWTPAAGKKFRLMRYMITVPSNSVAGAQADLVMSLLDGAGAIGVAHVCNIPVAAVLTAAPPLYVSGWIDLGNGILSALANNVLNMNLSFALTGGQVNFLACGTEE